MKILYVGDDPRGKTDIIMFALQNNIEVVFPGGKIEIAEAPFLSPETLLFERYHVDFDSRLMDLRHTSTTTVAYSPKRSKKKIRSKHFK